MSEDTDHTPLRETIAAAILREAAEVAASQNGCPCNTGHTIAHLLRRMADEQPAEAQGCWCGHPEYRHWHDPSGRMTFPDGCHDCRGWNGAHAYGQELPWLPEGDEPAAVVGQDGAQQ